MVALVCIDQSLDLPHRRKSEYMTDKLNQFAIEVLARAEEETQGWSLTIDGCFVKPVNGGTYTTDNPSTGKTIATVSFADAEDVAIAVAAGKEAFPAWRALHVDDRARMLQTFSAAVRARAKEFAILDAIDCGNPYEAMLDDVAKGAGSVDYFAGLGMEIKGETIPTPGGGLNFTRREPFGVTARILPFNHPIMFAVGKIASALITGNTVVMKLADQTPLSGLLLGKLIQDVFPAGVVNVLSGDGRTTGASLVQHPDICRIAFTGSVETGRLISQQSGIASLSLELGGKNPLVIFPDVDVESAAEAAVAGMNYTLSQGQSCGSTSRVFVHQSIHADFLERVKARVERIRVGSATDTGTEMGPLISRDHYKKVMGFIEGGKQQGARLLTGGHHVPGKAFENGYFVEPTVFSDVTNDMDIAQQEIFGPVMSILTWSNEEQMLKNVNDSRYGLCANIWTNDISRALRMADAVEVGYVWINGLGGKRFKGAPFGGVKNSGLGREHCAEEMMSFTQHKNINVRY
jgi:betaine-aldehyde dehydrogenase